MSRESCAKFCESSNSVRLLFTHVAAYFPASGVKEVFFGGFADREHIKVVQTGALKSTVLLPYFFFLICTMMRRFSTYELHYLLIYLMGF